MVNALTWSSLQVACLAETTKTQPPYTTIPADFAAIFPLATAYAEGRIYREFKGLLATRQVDTSLATTANNRLIPMQGMVNPNGGPIIVPERFALLVPGQGGTVTNVPVQFDRGSLALIDMVWPQSNLVVAPNILDFQPRYWDLIDHQTIVICPTPDQAYTCQITGLFQPTPIGPANENPVATVASTYLSTVYPDLLFAACMVHLTGGLLHNFGAQSDNPQRAQSWEQQFRTLMDSAYDEEMRRRGFQVNHGQPAPTPPSPPRMPPG